MQIKNVGEQYQNMATFKISKCVINQHQHVQIYTPIKTRTYTGAHIFAYFDMGEKLKRRTKPTKSKQNKIQWNIFSTSLPTHMVWCEWIQQTTHQFNHGIQLYCDTLQFVREKKQKNICKNKQHSHRSICQFV